MARQHPPVPTEDHLRQGEHRDSPDLGAEEGDNPDNVRGGGVLFQLLDRSKTQEVLRE